MITLEEFHQTFLQSILSDAESRGLMRAQAFYENVCEELTNIGDLTQDYTSAEYSKKGLEVYGYDYDGERKILSLLAHQFFQENEIQTLTRSHIDTKFKRLRTFFKKSVDGFYIDLEETSEAYSMAYNIYNYSQDGGIDKLRLLVLTDGKTTRNLLELPPESQNGVSIEFRVVDIEYLYKIYTSASDSGEFTIENIRLSNLKVDSASDEYESYLLVASGQLIYDIYESFGQKLFEQNVRTFLQFRGKVNKGIRNTIETQPEKFFAYNNGLTATASSLDFDDDGNIIRIKNFQIVNGGQTTSAIYAAKKKSKFDISDVAVQIKLSVVKDKENQNDFVSKVSEYANTQNKVSKSDFFSNSPFHKEFKNYSKRIWVAAAGGAQMRTHWFYERVRGEYLNEQAYLKHAEKKKFQLENPKKQMLDKTFLAKSENAWKQKPQVVSKGAQYSFAEFADYITKTLEEDNLAITEEYFKEAVARAIMFKRLEKMISDADWYDGGFRAQTVAYTLAYFSYAIASRNKHFNFNIIWEKQDLPDDLIFALEKISEAVYMNITSPPEGYANISQWCKKDMCWESVKKIRVGGFKLGAHYFIDTEEKKYMRKEEKKEKSLIAGIEIQTFVLEAPIEIWQKLYEYYTRPDSRGLTEKKRDILLKMSQGRLYLPSEAQSKILYDLYKKAESEGYAV